MRYYKITFSNPNGGFPAGLPYLYTSHPNDIYNPGCLEITFDIGNVFADSNIPPTHLRIHNIPVNIVQGARLYNGMNVVIEAGFKAANPNFKSTLPLENVNQSGIIAQGVVQTCYANWLGTDLVLDFLIWPNPKLGSANTMRSYDTGAGSSYPFQFQWISGSMSDAILNALKFMGVTKVEGTISNKLNSLPAGVSGYQKYVTTFQEFANYILKLSVLLVDPPAQNKDGTGVYQKYTGVRIAINQKTVTLYDGTTTDEKFVQLKYQEFIGQPTWVSANGELQSVHPMRNDIFLGGLVRYPAGIPSIIAPQYSPTLRQYNVNESAEPLRVFQVRHVGQFRGSSATSWATYVNAGSAIRINPNNPQEGVQKSDTQSYPYTPKAP